jgi:hypothetical protein
MRVAQRLDATQSYPLLSPMAPHEAKKAVGRWTDGRRFAQRVQVWSASERYLFHTHAEAAFRLCRSRAAEPGCPESKIWKITLLSTPSSFLRSGPPSASNPSHYAGQRYVYKQLLGYSETGRLATYALRPQRNDDRLRTISERSDYGGDRVKQNG